MEKNFIDEFIPSKDTRDYLHSIHHEFTDLEKATIVANHIMISTVTFTPAFSIGRSLTSAHPEPYPDQRLNKVEKGGVKQFEHSK